jgi:membrane protease YdiL (CAAX protease family)
VQRIFVIGLLFELSLVPLALLLGWWWNQPPLQVLDLQWRAVAEGTLAAVPLLALFAAGHRWPVGPLRRILQFLNGTVYPLLQQCSLAELALFGLAAGLGEEMLFRGVLQPALGTVLGPLLGEGYEPAAGLIAAGVLFGLAHCVTPTYAVLAALIGFILGGLLLATGNLLVPITTHTVYDLVAIVYLLRAGPNSLRPTGGAGREDDTPTPKTDECKQVPHDRSRETH